MAGIIDGGFTTPLLPTCPNGDAIPISDFDAINSVNFQPNSWDYYKASSSAHSLSSDSFSSLYGCWSNIAPAVRVAAAVPTATRTPRPQLNSSKNSKEALLVPRQARNKVSVVVHDPCNPHQPRGAPVSFKF
ncbi:hypothetical protein NADE_007870 [Nannochloris sp. 'desiccata']|nr:hypothetical protein NADE_007870 [Chlorella desiccata (nom. nud.)]